MTRPEPEQGVTRRAVIGGAALFAAGAGLGYAGGGLSGDGGGAAAEYPFFGANQSGIATPAQEFLSFAAFDLNTDSADDLRSLLQIWTAAAATLTRGKIFQPATPGTEAAPVDPGEAVGLGPAGLTITFGLGPSVFESAGVDRLGLVARRPTHLAALPLFSGDALEPARSGGDLAIQACAENPQVAFHAIHLLSRLAIGTGTLRWMQEGFGRTSATSRSQATPRNLMGFKDGTNNIRAEDAEQLDQHVWVRADDDVDWMAGGTYLVARRIKMLLDVWDVTSLEGQEAAIGRKKRSGAPLGQSGEFDRLDLSARQNGGPMIPRDAHVRLSAPEENDGARILRRGYSYSESTLPGSGEIDAGLFFIAFQRNPKRQFIPLQRRLAASDALNRHILHTASAVFACPPGARPGGFVGEGLFA